MEINLKLLEDKHKQQIQKIIELILVQNNDKGYLEVDCLKQNETFGVVTEWCDFIFTKAYEKNILLHFSGPFWKWNYPVVQEEKTLKPDWFNSLGEGKTVKPKFYLFWDKSNNVIKQFEESKQIGRKVTEIITMKV